MLACFLPGSYNWTIPVCDAHVYKCAAFSCSLHLEAFCRTDWVCRRNEKARRDKNYNSSRYTFWYCILLSVCCRQETTMFKWAVNIKSWLVVSYVMHGLYPTHCFCILQKDCCCASVRQFSLLPACLEDTDGLQTGYSHYTGLNCQLSYCFLAQRLWYMSSFHPSRFFFAFGLISTSDKNDANVLFLLVDVCDKWCRGEYLSLLLCNVLVRVFFSCFSTPFVLRISEILVYDTLATTF